MIYSVPSALRDQLMQRIMIIGSPGAGKTTLARQLGAILGINVIHLDRFFWQSSWVEPPRDEWRRVQEDLVQRPHWIMDGNYSATQNVRLAVADTIIFLDMPRWLCLWQALKRRIRYHGRSRPDLPPDCPESLDWGFLQYTWGYPRERRPKIVQRLAEHRSTKRIVVLQNRAETQRFLAAARRERYALALSSQLVEQH